MDDPLPYPKGYGRWYKRSKGWGMLFILVPIAIIVAVAPFLSSFLPGQGSHRQEPTAAALAVAQRFTRALFVNHDCARAQALESDRDLIDRCGHGSTEGAVSASATDVSAGTNFYLVQRSGAIVPHCQFVGAYSRYGDSASQRDANGDSCIAYQLIARTTASSNPWERGYLALYMTLQRHVWRVEAGTWWVEGGPCTEGCGSLWARRVPGQPNTRALTALTPAARTVAGRFATEVYAKQDCKGAALLAVSSVARDVSDRCGALDDKAEPGFFRLVSGSLRVLPRCRGGYPGQPSFEGDDNCVAFQLIRYVGGYRPTYEIGYLALYLARDAQIWKVSGYTADISQGLCGAACTPEWRRRAT
jgi:hypothetical protein